MKKREITENEIKDITHECRLREKAFFTTIRQSGLPPHTLKQLKIKDLEGIFNPNTPIPCKIKVPHKKSPAFIGHEATNYLKLYLKTRINLTQESLLFTISNDPNKEINTKDESRAFKLVLRKLKNDKKITFKIQRGKPSELRLYSLIRFYKKKAKPYLDELKNNNTLQNDEFYRKLYEDKARPFLEIETPMEIQQLMKENKELKNTTATMQEQINQIRQFLKNLTKYPPDKNGIIKIIVQPITEETALKELISTPEENQIDLTPDQQNIQLRRKLTNETKRPENDKRVRALSDDPHHH